MLMIETERLYLRQYQPADVSSILTLASDPIVREFIGNLPDSDEAAWSRLLRCAGHWSLFGCGTLAVVEKTSDRIIGEVGAGFFNRGVDALLDSVPEASWLFSSGASGRGYAFEAMSGLLEWIARSTRYSSLACLIEPVNAPSARLADKLGFRPLTDVLYRNKTFSLLTMRTAVT